MTENLLDTTWNYRCFGSVIGKLKPNDPTVFLKTPNVQYEDAVGNTVEENSRIFFLIQIH